MRFRECECACDGAVLRVDIVSVAVTLNGMTTFVSVPQRSSYAVNTPTPNVKKVDAV